LEIYKEDSGAGSRRPEDVDPEHTNLNARFGAAVADRVGTSNPIIARVLLQAATFSTQ
jgi:hypothetical protein